LSTESTRYPDTPSPGSERSRFPSSVLDLLKTPLQGNERSRCLPRVLGILTLRLSETNTLALHRTFERPPRGPRYRLAARANPSTPRRPALRAKAPRPVPRPADGLLRHQASRGQSADPHRRAHYATRIAHSTRRYRASYIHNRRTAKRTSPVNTPSFHCIYFIALIKILLFR